MIALADRLRALARDWREMADTVALAPGDDRHVVEAAAFAQCAEELERALEEAAA